MEVYLDKLNLKFCEGRSAIAQQLQSMGEVTTGGATSPSTGPSSCTRTSSAEGEEGHPNISNKRHLARLHFNNYKMAKGEGRGDVVEEEAAKAAEKNKVEAAAKAAKSSKAEERHVDSWTKQGQGGRWTRAHRSARRALFTPYKVAGGPAKKDSLKRLRITRGRYFSSGKTFKIIDDWTVQSHAHRLLEGAWIGTTDFRENVEYIDDDSDEGSDDGDRQTAGEVIRGGINSLGIKQRDPPEKQTPEKQTPEKQTPEKQHPEKHTSEVKETFEPPRECELYNFESRINGRRIANRPSVFGPHTAVRNTRPWGSDGMQVPFMGVFTIWTYGRMRVSRAHSLTSCAPTCTTRLSRFALKDAVRSLVLLVGALDLGCDMTCAWLRSDRCLARRLFAKIQRLIARGPPYLKHQEPLSDTCTSSSNGLDHEGGDGSIRQGAD